MQNNLVRI